MIILTAFCRRMRLKQLLKERALVQYERKSNARWKEIFKMQSEHGAYKYEMQFEKEFPLLSAAMKEWGARKNKKSPYWLC